MFFYHGCDRPPPTFLPLPSLVLLIVLITVIVFWVILLDWFDPNSFLLEVHTCPLQVHLDTDVYWPTSDKNRGDQSIRLSVRVIMSTLEHSHSPERYNNHQTVENWGWVPLLYNSCESYFHNIFLRYYFLSIYRWAGAVVWYTHTNRYADMQKCMNNMYGTGASQYILQLQLHYIHVWMKTAPTGILNDFLCNYEILDVLWEMSNYLIPFVIDSW